MEEETLESLNIQNGNTINLVKHGFIIFLNNYFCHRLKKFFIILIKIIYKSIHFQLFIFDFDWNNLIANKTELNSNALPANYSTGGHGMLNQMGFTS